MVRSLLKKVGIQHGTIKQQITSPKPLIAVDGAPRSILIENTALFPNFEPFFRDDDNDENVAPKEWPLFFIISNQWGGFHMNIISKITTHHISS